MAVSGKTAAPHEIPYFLDTDKPPDMAAVTKAMADRLQLLLPSGTKSDGRIVVVESGAPAYKAMSGDATIDKTGTLTIAAAIRQALFSPGDIKATAAPTAPEGWLLCEGQSLLRTGTYAALFAAISTTYGTVDGTHFNLPDLRGRAPVGKGTHADVDSLADSDGLAVGSRTPKHTHTGPSHTHTYSGTTSPPSSGETVDAGSLLGDADNVHTHTYSGTTSASGTGNTGSSNGAYAVVNWMIKT